MDNIASYFLLNDELCYSISPFEAVHVHYNTYISDIEYTNIFFFQIDQDYENLILLPNLEEIILQYIKPYTPFIGSDDIES